MIAAVVLALAAAQDAPAARPALEWADLPALPDPHGLGGPFVAVLPATEASPEALLVAGGANFPDGPPWEGGAKAWHAGAWVLDAGTGAWARATDLPAPRAYGAVVPTDAGPALLGGGDGEECSAEVLVATRGPDGEVALEAALPPLPAPSQLHAAARVGDRIVVVPGQRSADPADVVPAVWVLDLAAPPGARAWEVRPPPPFGPRVKAVVAAQADAHGTPRLHLFSGEVVTRDAGGAVRRAYPADAWSYDPATEEWTELAPPPRACAAGTALPLGQAHVLVLSGVDRVPPDVPLAEREEFTGEVLAYHTITDTWVRAGAMPQGVVTTGAAAFDGRLVVASGEVRPGVRTTRVQAARHAPAPARLGAVNLAVLGLYLAALVAMGALFARRNRGAEDFFLAGHRIPWWAAGLSIYATQLSAITYVATPAKAFLEDWVYALTSFTILAMAPIVVVFYLPFYRRLGIATAYEYLERRFHVSARLFGSASFILFQVARMAIVVFLPSLALSTVTGLDVFACVLTIGTLATLYTVLGGMEAVVWTDVLQVFVLLGGMAVALVVAVVEAGGFGAALDVALAADKLRAVAPGASWTETATWSVLLGAMFLQFGPYTSDQAVVQRYLSTRSERAAARGVILNGIVAVPFTFAFYALGTALFAYFSARPEELTVGMKNDEVLPLFLALELPAGLAGLVLAGIFAASMSSLDSSMHSIATAWTNDWKRRLGWGRASDLATGRSVTVLMGVLGTGVAALMAAADIRSLYDAFQSVLGLLISPLAGVFVLGVFTRRATTAGVHVGAATAIAVLWFAQNRTDLHFMLYGALGTTTCVAAGYAASLVVPGRRRELRGLTWWTRAPGVGA